MASPDPTTDAATGFDETERPSAGATLWIASLFLIYALLVGVGVIGDGFKWISGGAGGAERIFAFASNPLIGVVLGILATALVQSSSTVTSVIVGLVAGGVPVATAVPMIIGANMGTTITNTIVALGNISDRGSFARSMQAATVHDFFNLYSILIFLPVELAYRPLEKMAGAAAGWFEGENGASIKDFDVVGGLTDPVVDAVLGVMSNLPATIGATLTIGIGIALIVASVLYLGRLLKTLMMGRARGLVDGAIGRGPLAGVASGTVVTVLVQSSSTTTSLVVPLGGAGVLTVRQILPFTLGANLGTCITALLAATSVSGPYETVALQIALVHLFYNLIGVVLFMVLPWLRALPLKSAGWLGARVAVNRFWAFAYLLGVFFVLPGLAFVGQSVFSEPNPSIVAAEETGAVEEAEVESRDVEIE